MTEPQSVLIQSLRCRQLFGRFSYRIDFDNVDRSNHLGFIYGDNGTGKTTLLKLVYCLLSPNAGEGNRSYMAGVPFENFEVQFNDGMRIVADRQLPNLQGSYNVAIVDKKNNIDTFQIAADDDSVNRTIGNNEKELPRYETRLRGLPFQLLYVSHDREIKATDPRIVRRPRPRTVHLPDGRVVQQSRQADGKFDLRHITRLVHEDTSQKLLERANVAQGNINSIYLSIARRLSKPRAATKGSAASRAGRVLQQLEKMESSYPQYERIRALSSIPFGAFREILSAPTGKKHSVLEVLEPFLEGTQARMANIRPVVSNVTTLLDELNSYFVDKRVSYDIFRQFSIADDQSHKLDLDWLSSGEKQILFLFCTILLMKDTPTIVLIDEPELSLNMKWQRNIVRSMERIVDDSAVQFVFATHAFEILAQYQESVRRLENVVQ